MADHKMMWFKAPPAVYFGYGGTEEALKDLQGLHRAFIVSDRNCVSLGFTKKLTDRLEQLDIASEVFGDVISNPTDAIVRLGIKKMETFQPDHIIAIGGGSCMDVAKILRVIYDPNNSCVKLKDLYAFTYMQLLTDREQQTGVSSLPPCDQWVKKLICIPTTSGTGSEMTPIAFVTDEEETNMKRPIVSWRMTPDIVINDGYYTQTLTPVVVASSGLDALCRSLESAVSLLSNDYTVALSHRCAKLLNDNLVASFTTGDSTSRSNCHNAASIGGMAMANAFLGLGHAISFVLQNFLGSCGLPNSLGSTTMLVMGQVIRFNSSRCSKTAEKYAMLADHLEVTKTDATPGHPDDVIKYKVGALVARLEELKKLLHLPATIAASGVKKTEFDAVLDKMAGETLKVVGCAKTNPVQATVEDITGILKKAYTGDLN